MSKQPTRRIRGSAEVVAHGSDIFRKLGCEEAIYVFLVPLEEFDLKGFYRETGISPNHAGWSAVIGAKKQSSGYHIHFNGRVESKNVRLELKYFDGSLKPRPGEQEPFAESMMPWIGTFFRDHSWRAMVDVRFEKSAERWRSRFNLPFKVTMADNEVVIDGVSLALPNNPFGAVAGWLSKAGQRLFANALLNRNVEFAKFNLREDLVEFNEAIKIYAEEVRL